VAEDDRGDDEPIGEAIAQLTEDAKAYASAELAYYRALAVATAKEVRDAAALGSLALLFAFAALVALAVGAVMVLAPLIGPFAATAIVFVVSFALAGWLGWLAWKKISDLLEGDA